MCAILFTLPLSPSFWAKRSCSAIGACSFTERWSLSLSTFLYLPMRSRRSGKATEPSMKPIAPTWRAGFPVLLPGEPFSGSERLLAKLLHPQDSARRRDQLGDWPIADLQPSNRYRGFESCALRQRGCTRVVPGGTGLRV